MAFPAGLPAQAALVTTRISATAKDALFLVDNQAFTAPAIFTWPAGSKHELVIDPWQYAPAMFRGRYVFQHWLTSAGPLGTSSNRVTITADAGIAWYSADLRTEYAISLVFFRCPVGPCASPGTVWVNQSGYQEDTDVWADAASTVTLDAAPNSGFVFTGWVNGPSAPLYSFVLNEPATVYPHFTVARAIQLLTLPDRLQLLADRAPVTAPLTLEWGWNTTHTLGAVSPQRDTQGRLWVFRSWSDGGPINHTYQVEPVVPAASVVAQFVPAVSVMLLTDPAGLTLTADGVDGVSPRYLSWAPGNTYAVTAPVRQTDSAGGPWVFRAWSNGAANPQVVPVTDEQVETGIRLTAVYDPLSRIRVESVPGGLPLAVDGAPCRTPCEVERAVGTTVRLFAPPSLGVSDGVRLDFDAWEGVDGGMFQTAAGFRRITARYLTSYRLELRSQPPDAGLWKLSPAGTGGFYRAGSSVGIGLEPAAGMKLHEWQLDARGSANPVTLIMDAPHAVRAVLDRLPDPPAPPRVVNAAGKTPAAAVAPGSIASLFGADLADSTGSSQSNLLPQSLAGVTLRCSGRLLALLYVSPEQINFQVTSDLPPGQYKLEVHRENGPVREVEFAVARNAPGLFVAAHLDGSPVTPDSPARRGEVVVLYGTGFGAYQPMPADGFPVPYTPRFPLADVLEVWLQGRTLAPEFAGAAPGAVGLAMVQVRIPEDLDAAVPASMVVRVGGVESNALAVSLR